jgi:hypothetical protein
MDSTNHFIHARESIDALIEQCRFDKALIEAYYSLIQAQYYLTNAATIISRGENGKI